MKYITKNVNERSNRTDFWLPTDGEDTYKAFHEGKRNLYRPGDFTYTYNDKGFRCDDFSLSSELPIMFIGCSCTEGVGLPLETTWAYQLVTKIREATGKIIPFWSVALGGSGIDTQSQYLYWISQRINFKYVFGLLPPSGRREYMFGVSRPKFWGPGWTNDPISKLFADRNYGLYQDRRSMIIIDSVAKQKQSEIWLSEWDIHPTETKELYDDFPDINFIDHNIRNIDHARDWLHFGPSYHNEFANIMWDKVKHNFI